MSLRGTTGSRGRTAVDGWSLGTRLFVSQAVVLVASVATAGLVAALIGPSLFHTHLLESGQEAGSPEMAHIEQAFTSTSVVSLGGGLLVALAFALIVTWYLTRRIRRPIATLADAAHRISAGDYSARVQIAGAGPELATLADSFNQMAERFGSVEDTRRRLLSDLAHELRTPIATLSAHLEGLGDGVVAWDDSTLAVLQNQAERLARLARDLDDVSRAEEGRIALDVSVQSSASLVERAVDQMRDRYAAKSVLLVGDADDSEVRVDPQRIAQVLDNLLANALRHTPSGGRVAVSAHRGHGGAVVITVADDGEGMTGEQLAHIFERFYRGDSARAHDEGGSGIGLTIARAIADAHGGRLGASSPGPGHGSTFTLALPGGSDAHPSRSS
ncbi:HAMP domain-containing sensor histidine kinase [Brooklawnia cerclae]|uniref:Signal transduction histidine-protein kinase/phosphatase MprB n=1 Tax=Brooklawnia cerclae TaxID=349934 RepID=A0ABX0SIX2_9ACTN|nr:ATP-binding protein [Brooklawnia cerclae]NIH57925.1 signal transduction histidine kinase [Brooklawnia cerclae]